MKKRLQWCLFVLLMSCAFSNYMMAQNQKLNELIPLTLKHMILNDYHVDFTQIKSDPAAFIEQVIQYNIENDCERVELRLSIQMLEAYEEEWVNSAWVNEAKETMSYDANFNMVEALFYEWINNQYVTVGRWTYTYDGNGNQLTWLMESYENNAWVNESRWIRTFDGNNNELTGEWQMWENNAWVGFMRWESTYDANNRITFQMQQMWDSGAYIDFNRTTYSYDGNGRLSQTVTEMSLGMNMWMNSSRHTYTYDGNGNNTVMLSESWSLMGNAWENNFRTTNTFNGNNQITETVDESWNGTGWENQYKYTHEYNGMLETVYTMQRWISAAWENFGKTLYTYDGQDRPIEDLHQVWFSNAWENSYRWTYVWGEPVTDVKDDLLSADDFVLAQNYPNPFNPSTTIKFNLPYSSNVTLTIFNSIGEEVTQLINGNVSKGIHTVQFEAEKLNSGIYFYQLKANDFIQMKKMMLLK
jgi:hypothetical protein